MKYLMEKKVLEEINLDVPFYKKIGDMLYEMVDADKIVSVYTGNNTKYTGNDPRISINRDVKGMLSTVLTHEPCSRSEFLGAYMGCKAVLDNSVTFSYEEPEFTIENVLQ